MSIIKFDSNENSGVVCPETGIEIDFLDENMTDYINDTFVISVFLSIHPEECMIDGELNDEWKAFYELHSDEMNLEEMIQEFPGPYKGLEVYSHGMSCGPVHDIT